LDLTLKEKLIKFYAAAYEDYKKAMNLAKACVSDMNEAHECWQANFGDTKELDKIFNLNQYLSSKEKTDN
jgi:hypothetical protein